MLTTNKGLGLNTNYNLVVVGCNESENALITTSITSFCTNRADPLLTVLSLSLSLKKLSLSHFSCVSLTPVYHIYNVSLPLECILYIYSNTDADNALIQSSIVSMSKYYTFNPVV